MPRKPFSKLTKDWSPERKAKSEQRVAEMLAEMDARQPEKQPTNHDLYEFLFFEVQEELFSLRREVGEIHRLVLEQSLLIRSLLGLEADPLRSEGIMKLGNADEAIRLYEQSQARLREVREELEK